MSLAMLVLGIHLVLLWLTPLFVVPEPPSRLTGPLIIRAVNPNRSDSQLATSSPPAAKAPPAPPRAPKSQAAESPQVMASTLTTLDTPVQIPVEQSVPPEAEPTPAQSVASNPDQASQAENVPEVPVAQADAPAAQPATSTGNLALPGSTRLNYTITGTVRGVNYHAGGELLWRHDGAQYEARLQIGAFLLGTRVQSSRGQITDQGLRPKRFSDKVRSEVAAHFVWEQGKIIFSANKPEAPLEPGAQDQLSVFIQLASMFASQPMQASTGTVIAMQAVGARESVSWRFEVNGFERLQLPGGALDVLKITRSPTRPYDLKAELWLAPALGWLPARIRLSQENGDFVDQQWSETEAP